MHSALIEVCVSDDKETWSTITQMPLTKELYSVESSDASVFISSQIQWNTQHLLGQKISKTFIP